MLQPREFYKEELSGFFFWWGAWWGEEAEPPSNYSLTPVPSPNGEGREYCCLQVKESLPKPLRRRGCVPQKYSFLSKRASLSCEKGVSSLWREPFFTPTKRPLYLQIMVFTPLSIRRGVGGEAVVGLGVRLLVESKKGVSFCVFPCSFRNSVSLSGSVPFVYSVLKMP